MQTLKSILRWLILLSLPGVAHAQFNSYTHECSPGATAAVTSGLQSTNKLEGIFPQCTVTVYQTGTTNLATIYSNSTGTSLNNPFTAPINGIYTFYASPSSLYDVLMTGAGMAATTTPAISVNGGGSSSSGVTSIAVGSGLACTPLVSGTCTGAVTISLATAFTINSFSGCAGTVELGHSIANPAFTATYSVTPASANITNTDSINSPFNLTTPFTAATVTGTFVHTSVTTTTFTLTAIQGSTQTASCTDTWEPRIFSGLGAAGATSTVTASGTTAILSTSDVLASAGLGAETVGQSFGPFEPTNQKIYLLLIGGSHTFTDACNGFPFAFDTPTAVSFVNADGATVSMWLYDTTNLLTYIGGCAYTPRIAS